MSDAARAFIRGINSLPGEAPPADDDPMALLLMRQLQDQGLGHYFDDPVPDPDEERRQALRDLAEFNRDLHSGKFHADLEMRRQIAAEEERVQHLPAAALLCEVLQAGSTAPSGHIPLNGMGVVNAMAQALTGSGGTVTVEGQ